MSESYLYTEEMIAEAYDHLSSDGVVVAQFGDRDFAARPMRTARYLVTSRQALDDRVDAFADHVGLVYEGGGESQVETVSTIMLFRPQVDASTVERVQASVANVPAARSLYLHGAARADGITSDIIDASDAELDDLVDSYPLDISSIDDDRPFFWHFTDFRTVLTDWDRSFQDAEIAIGERLLLMLLAMAAVVAAVLLWVPFAATRRRDGSAAVSGRWRLFVYFASIGLAFMLIEISMIQRFALVLGFPTLSLSVSLFTLLIATAVGARSSAVARRWPRRGLPFVFAGLVVLAALYVSIAEPLTTMALSWPQWARIALVVILLFPIGLLLGVFLPTGMDAVIETATTTGADEGRIIAWCWAVNGFFSVLGASLTTVVSMAFGFDRAVLFGLLLYAVAAVVLGARRAVPYEPPIAVDPIGQDAVGSPV